jgi:Lumazine binding domain
MQIHVPQANIKYIVPKGFICVDGTSLTICDVDAVASTFTFMLVAHTQQNVIIPNKAIGESSCVCLYICVCVCVCVCANMCVCWCVYIFVIFPLCHFSIIFLAKLVITVNCLSHA